MRRTTDGILTGDRQAARLPAPARLDISAALFLDVDGTLLKIAERPDLVQVPSGLPALLGDVARQRGGALALVSGRPLRELDHLFRPWRGAAAGLHGSERRRADGTADHRIDIDAAAALDHIRKPLAALAGAGSGLILEDKGATVALHYRAQPQRAEEIHAITEALLRETSAALRLVPGKMVVEFQPRGSNKGSAVAAFLGEPPFFGRRPVFVGDDVTDEDGFTEVNRRHGIAIRVGQSAETAARWALPSVAAVLGWLAENQEMA